MKQENAIKNYSKNKRAPLEIKNVIAEIKKKSNSIEILEGKGEKTPPNKAKRHREKKVGEEW